ncbi:transformer-2 protein homolog beta [Aedes albopictus]|uniref:RRM domain-containing protein n=1 Tax=Aedes albopictus TaxID=7160 RepID=A0ABM1XZA6_AEDAL
MPSRRRDRSMGQSPEPLRARMGIRRRSRDRIRNHRSPSPPPPSRFDPPQQRAPRSQVLPIRRRRRSSGSPSKRSGAGKFSQWFCLGVFGMSPRTTERDLRRLFSEYGPIECIRVVCEPKTRESRGFGFVYFRNRRDAVSAKARSDGMKFDGRRLRVDFSMTDRPHSPTPGRYMGPDRIRIERRRSRPERR